MNPWQMMRAFGQPSGGGGGAPTGYDTVMTSKSPWGYWKLDETTITVGGVAADSSGNARSGTYMSADAVSVSGLFGGSSRAIKLPALAGRYGVSLPSYLMATGEKLSIVSFIDVPAVDSTSRAIVSADENDGTSRQWQWRLRSGKLEFVTILPSVTTTASSSTLAVGTRHMVAVVFDPALPAASGVVKIYIDGVLDAQSTAAITISSGNAKPAIGNRTNATGGTQDCFQGGTLDNVALWRNVALTATDIADLWAARNT